MVAPMTISLEEHVARAKREEKLSKRFKRWMDGDDEFAGRWDFNKILRALQRLERIDRAAIAAVREREGPAEAMRAELDALSASHKDLAHRLARIGEELEGARERLEDMRRANAAMEAERDTARALLKDTAIFLRRNSDSWLDEDETNGFTVRIDKELGPTETKGEQHENNV